MKKHEGAIMLSGAVTESEAAAMVNQRLNDYSDRYKDKGIIIERKDNYVTGCEMQDDMIIVSYTVDYQGTADGELDLLFMDGEDE